MQKLLWVLLIWLAPLLPQPSRGADQYFRELLFAKHIQGEKIYEIPAELADAGVAFADPSTRLADIPGTAFIFLCYDRGKFDGFLYGQLVGIAPPSRGSDPTTPTSTKVTESDEVEPDGFGPFEDDPSGNDQFEANNRRLEPIAMVAASESSLRERAYLAAMEAVEKNHTPLGEADKTALRSALGHIRQDHAICDADAAKRFMTVWVMLSGRALAASQFNFALVPVFRMGNAATGRALQAAETAVVRDLINYLNHGQSSWIPLLFKTPATKGLAADLRTLAEAIIRLSAREYQFIRNSLANAQNTAAAASLKKSEQARRCSSTLLDSNKPKDAILRTRTR